MGDSVCDLCTWEVQEEEIMVIPLYVMSARSPLGYPTPPLEETKDNNETKGPEKGLGTHSC